MSDHLRANVKKKIRSLRAQLLEEKRKFGGYFDNQGMRYVIPELYLSIQDYKGALRYFNWFEQEFPDDIVFPDVLFAWTVTLFHNQEYKNAVKKAYQTLFLNTYLFDVLLNKNPIPVRKYETMGIEELRHARQIESLCKSYLTKDFTEWLSELTSSKEFMKNKEEYIAIQIEINEAPSNEKRKELRDKKTGFEKKLLQKEY